MYFRASNARGHANHGWLDSRHSFSFANYYDPAHMGFSNLRVINEDRVKPGMGFGTHGHQDMEIISYVISGSLAHRDSEGNVETIPAGDIQIMSAGTGIRHSEFNASDNEDVHFLQIWVLPQKAGIAPRYEQKTIPEQSGLTTIVSPQGGEHAVGINADAELAHLCLTSSESINLGGTSRRGYLHLIKGSAVAAGQKMTAGDAIGWDAGEALTLEAEQEITAIVFDLP